MENHCKDISSSENDTIWIKSEVKNEFDSISQDLNLAEEIYVKVKQEEIDSTKFYPKMEEDVELNYQEEKKTSKQTLCENKWFNCSYCEYRSNYKFALVRHEKAKHSSDKSEWFKCTYCEYCSSQKGTLLKHEWAKHSTSNTSEWFTM